MSVGWHPMTRSGSTYLPSMRTDRWTPGVPCGEPAVPTGRPRVTLAPTDTPTSARYEADTLTPGIGSMVTVLIPATDPANVTTPDAGAATVSPTAAA